jgi:hypothetical protein
MTVYVLLKLLRGNGVVTARALYKGSVSYIPTYTIWVEARAAERTNPGNGTRSKIEPSGETEGRSK